MPATMAGLRVSPRKAQARRATLTAEKELMIDTLSTVSEE